MSSEYIGEFETKDINDQVERILRDLGNPEPPLSLIQVRDLLKLDLKYYSAKDPSHLQELKHRLKVAGKQVAARPGLILDVVTKAKLSALWVPDTKRILIDSDTPKAKHRWIEGHEISHSIIPWHEDFLFGDSQNTLSPACDEIVEAEANYGAGRLLFLGDRFGEEARDMDLSFKSIKTLASRYKNTITTTLWRTIEEREPGRAVFGMISAHPNHPEIGYNEKGDVHYFMRSPRFREQFNNVIPEVAYNLLKKHATWKKTGPVIDAKDLISDVNGDSHEFRIESFSNSYTLLTYGVCAI